MQWARHICGFCVHESNQLRIEIFWKKEALPLFFPYPHLSKVGRLNLGSIFILLFLSCKIWLWLQGGGGRERERYVFLVPCWEAQFSWWGMVPLSMERWYSPLKFPAALFVCFPSLPPSRNWHEVWYCLPSSQEMNSRWIWGICLCHVYRTSSWPDSLINCTEALCISTATKPGSHYPTLMWLFLSKCRIFALILFFILNFIFEFFPPVSCPS